VSLVCSKAEKAPPWPPASSVARPSPPAARWRANAPTARPTTARPRYLAEQARKLGKEHGLKVSVLERKDCEKLGMGSFLAVAQGSESRPSSSCCAVAGRRQERSAGGAGGQGHHLRHRRHLAQAGAEMDEMKYDMGGAASVLGTLRAWPSSRPRST
jgi:leucyl aminopeptidase